MKKRVLSIVLAMIMIATLIPAIALVSYANGTEGVAVDYSDYYYDGGHLEAYVDLTGLTADDVVNASSASNVTEDTRVFYHATAYSGGAARRSYVKISGGANEGKYFIITVGGQTWAADGSLTVDQDGVLVFANADGKYNKPGTQTYQYSQMGNGSKAGVYVGRAFTYDEALNTTSWNGVEAAITADTAGDWAKAVAGNSFTIETTVKMATHFGDSAVQGHFNQFAAIGAINAISGVHGSASGDSYVYDYLTLGFAGNSFAQKYLSSTVAPGAYAQVASTVTFDEANGYYGADYLIGDTLYSSAYAPTGGVSVADSKVCFTHDALKAHTAYASAVYGSQMYYVRVYDIDLGEAEMLQNHFVDICNYNKVSADAMAAYAALTAEEKAVLYNWAKDKTLGDDGIKAATEAKISEIAAQRTLAEQTAAEALGFVGYQARLHGNVGVRSIFNIDTTKLGDFELVAYGAMVGMAKTGADFDTYTVNYDGENITSANAAVTSSLDSSFKNFGTAEKAHVLKETEGLDNYYMFAYTVDYINGSIDENGAIDGQSYIDANKEAEMFFRAFVILEANGINYIAYVDGASANYDNTSVSLVDVSNYYKAYNEGEYADNACIKAVVGE